MINLLFAFSLLFSDRSASVMKCDNGKMKPVSETSKILIVYLSRDKQHKSNCKNHTQKCRRRIGSTSIRKAVSIKLSSYSTTSGK